MSEANSKRSACDTPNYAADKLRSFIREAAPAQCRVLSRGDECDCLLCCVDRLVAPHAALTEFMRLFEDGVLGTSPEAVSTYNEAVRTLPEPVFPPQCRSGGMDSGSGVRPGKCIPVVGNVVQSETAALQSAVAARAIWEQGVSDAMTYLSGSTFGSGEMGTVEGCLALLRSLKVNTLWGPRAVPSAIAAREGDNMEAHSLFLELCHQIGCQDGDNMHDALFLAVQDARRYRWLRDKATFAELGAAQVQGAALDHACDRATKRAADRTMPTDG